MYDYVLKNDNLEKAVSIIEEIIRQESKEEN
jgi:guanylate kinase